jgi:DNA-binding MarR family transcriptional regulator
LRVATKATSPLLLDDQLCFALYTTSLAMTKVYKPLLEELGLTYPQYLVLLVLWETDGISLRELAERLHQDPGAMTPVVKRLEGQGYLRRQRNTKDERELVIGLTPPGRALRSRARRVHAAIGLACGLPEAELGALRDQLLRLRARLEA